MPKSARSLKRKTYRELSKTSEEENKKIYRYIRTCFYANSLELPLLYEILYKKVMPDYPKFMPQDKLEEYYTDENRDKDKVKDQLLDCNMSSTDIMAIENIIRKKNEKVVSEASDTQLQKSVNKIEQDLEKNNL